MENIIESVYTKICQGLLEKHKLLFSFYICTAIGKSKSTINEQEWILFLRGILNSNTSNNNNSDATGSGKEIKGIDLTIHTWMTKSLYRSACLLEDLIPSSSTTGNTDENNDNPPTNTNPFSDLAISLVRDQNDWKNWMESEEPFSYSLPADWNSKLSSFQKMILIRCLRYVIANIEDTEYSIYSDILFPFFYISSISITERRN